MVTRPHADIALTGLPLLVLRLTLTFVAAALSYKYVEEPIRHGALERQWARYKTAPADTQRKLMARFSFGAAGLVVGLVIIVVGLGNGGSAAAPAAFGDRTEVVVHPGDTIASTTTAPGTPTTVPTTGPAPPITAPGTPVSTVTAIGDSVMLGAYAPLKSTIDTMYNAAVTGVDAAESRQFAAGVDLIQSYKDRGELGQIVVVQLGTNGPIDPGDFDRMMGILADRQKVVLINAKEPRGWEQQVNDTLAGGVARYKNAVLLDWHSYGAAHPEFFYDDGIHLRPEGAAAYANFVARKVIEPITP